MSEYIPAPTHFNVFVSSTSRDLPEHRKSVIDAIWKSGFYPLAMERDTATPVDAVEYSLSLVEQCDVYIGIFAHRYGFIPDSYDISITEMEYRRAVEKRKPILIYIMDSRHEIKVTDYEADEKKQTKLEKLKQELMTNYVVGFFTSASDLYAQVLQSLSNLKHKLDKPTIPRPNLYENLHTPTYTKLFGVNSISTKVENMLQDGSGYRIISFQGMGGIGKTALADFIVRGTIESMMQGRVHLDGICWITAKPIRSESWDERQSIEKILGVNPEQIFDMLGQQLQIENISTFSLERKLSEITKKLRSGTYLVVIDNLQTSGDVETMLTYLPRLANPSWFIMTSRGAVDETKPVSTFSLQELSQEDSIAILRYESRDRIQWVQSASDDVLAQIYNVTGGNPQALKLVVGQLTRYSLDKILAGLQGSTNKAIQEMYRSIYQQSWGLLTEIEKTVLRALGRVGPNGANEDLLQKLSKLSESELETSVDGLREKMLLIVDTSRPIPQYKIHQLTHTFLTKEVFKLI